MTEQTAASRPPRASIRQYVADTLRAALIAGELVPGQVYSAPALAKQLDVSATPIREAMLDLARDGMVDVVPNTGFRITEVTAHDLDQIAEVRLLLEVPIMVEVAAASGAERDAQLNALRPIVDEMVDAARRKDLTAYLSADATFHTHFLALHGNEILVATVRELRDRTRLHGLKGVADAGHLVENTNEHYAMIDAALEHDRTAMEQIMRNHLSHVRTNWAAGEAPQGSR
ncbi:GntR family transcriptional regulator [Salinibacterium sp. NYA9b]